MDPSDIVPRCSICTEAFNSNARKPTVLGCGHSFCEECVNKIGSRTGRCPSCQSQMQFRLINYQVLDHLENVEKVQELQKELEMKLKALEIQNPKAESQAVDGDKKIFCSTVDCKNSFKLEIARICQTCSLNQSNNRRNGNNNRNGQKFQEKTFPITPKSKNNGNNYHYQQKSGITRIWHIKEPQFEMPPYEKAERALLCAECVLDGAHKSHNILRYFDLKKETELIKFAGHLAESFGESSTDLWPKAQQADQKLTDNLKAIVEANQSATSWQSFEEQNQKIASSVQLIKEEKIKMMTAMNAYIKLIEELKPATPHTTTNSRDPNAAYRYEYYDDDDY